MDIKALAYVRIESTEPSRWETFATEVMGMVVAPQHRWGDNLYLKLDDYAYRYCIVPGQQDAFLCAGWELGGPEAWEQALAELDAAGVDYRRGSEEEAAERNVAAFVSLRDPGGQLLELCLQPRLDYLPLLPKVPVSGFATGYHGDMGLGHIAMATPCLAETRRFYVDLLGFGQTDYLTVPVPGEDKPHGLHFLHCANPRHHSLALYEDSQPHPGNLVHLMAEVQNMDDLGRFTDRIHASGTRVITGMGRHTNDQMVSIYVETPAGFALEYGYDGVQIDWRHYTPTESTTTSHWGHRWGQG